MSAMSMRAKRASRRVLSTGDGFFPAGDVLADLAVGHGRFEVAVGDPDALDVVDAAPEADADAGEEGGAEDGGVDHLRADELHAEDVGLELHEEVVGGGTAVDFQGAELE